MLDHSILVIAPVGYSYMRDIVRGVGQFGRTHALNVEYSNLDDQP